MYLLIAGVFIILTRFEACKYPDHLLTQDHESVFHCPGLIANCQFNKQPIT